jgi:hypothetical protein
MSQQAEAWIASSLALLAMMVSMPITDYAALMPQHALQQIDRRDGPPGRPPK